MSKIPSLSAGKWPENVGILAMEVYFPYTCVNQTELESFDGVSAGKYTIGLGLSHMGFCGDCEDVHSLALTVVQGLLEANHVAYTDIGMLEVGTETILDKSKAVKTVLMQLFAECGNTNVEGIDTTNACYGGTQALFNAVSWVESSAWDGRFALVVTSDIAVYASGNARPTGGAGAIAMLIGPNAPLVLERGLRAVHMEHTYDFYKPDLSSEYPIVDGKLSIQCYLKALDICYQRFGSKAGTADAPFTIRDASFFAFHSPFARLVQKSLARLKLNDFMADSSPDMSEGGVYTGLEVLKSRTLEDTRGDRDIEKLMMKSSEEEFRAKTDPTLLLSREVGNMYTASLYSGVASLLAIKKPEEVAGKRMVLFSYGSGLASAMYSLRVSSDTTPGSPLSSLMESLSSIPARLKARKTVSPPDFEQTMLLREKTHHSAPYIPVGDRKELFPGTYYLASVDEKHRRTYERLPPAERKPSITLRSPLRKFTEGQTYTNGAL